MGNREKRLYIAYLEPEPNRPDINFTFQDYCYTPQEAIRKVLQKAGYQNRYTTKYTKLKAGESAIAPYVTVSLLGGVRDSYATYRLHRRM